MVTEQEKLELHKYLDPRVLAKISRLDLLARLVVEGFISGLHKSPFHGFSVEFASHREYVPGDDLKHLDWKVQAKTDRLVIKQYEEETNLKSTFIVDVSESMRYKRDGKESLTKYHYACAVAASLAHLLLHQQDSCGLAVFDDALKAYVPSSSNTNQIKSICHALDVQQPKAKTAIEPILHAIAEKVSRRGMICLVSDLFPGTGPEADNHIDSLLRGLQHFRHYDHEVMVLHIMDEDELDFSFQGNTMFNGLEATGRLTIEPRSLREAYLTEVDNFCREVKRKCVANRIDYKRISTADYLDAALCSFLAARAAAARKASAKR
ncbi:MAG: DUF58 domain-containing protein [Planctomycetes bacterium]|nr:DUF58 domain-containing protein [Planctomycetota bacterium]